MKTEYLHVNRGDKFIAIIIVSCWDFSVAKPINIKMNRRSDTIKAQVNWGSFTTELLSQRTCHYPATHQPQSGVALGLQV